MINGACSQCQSESVYAVKSFGREGTLSIGFFGKPAIITYLVCTKCGYLETYILDEHSLADIEQKGKKVTPG